MEYKAHQPCTFADCGSSDAMTYFSDGHSWCFSCNRGVFPNKDGDDTVLQQASVLYRGINPEISEWLGITTLVDTTTGEVVQRTYPYGEECNKIRRHPKMFHVEGEQRKDISRRLFLKDHEFLDSKFVTIVEGEEDAAAHIQMMGKYPCYSASSASSLLISLRENYDHLMKFEQIIFCMDADAAGDAALLKAINLFPYEKVYIVHLSPEYKDPNGYLIAGKQNEYSRLWWQRSRWSPDAILDSPADLQKLFEHGESYSFEPTNIPELDKVIYGLTKSCVTLIKADEGLGKTELLGFFEYQILKNTEHHIGVIHFEETPLRILQRFASYELMNAVHLPESTISKEQQIKAIDELNAGQRLHILSIQDIDSISGILEHIRYLAKVVGCSFIFMDPVNHIGDMGDDTVTKNLDGLAKKLSKMAADLNIGIIITAHINDDGRVRDSKMFEKTAYIRLELSRDPTSPDPTLRNTTRIVCSKNRPWATTGPAGSVLFDRESFTLSPIDSQMKEGIPL